MADAKMLNKEKAIARLRAIPDIIKQPVARDLKIEVDALVAAQKRAAPVSDLEKNPGEFRDSIHDYENPDRELSYRIIADAKDEKGRFIGQWIENGHTTPTGTNVPASPSFWVTYRARKKGMRRRLNASARKAAQAAFKGK